MINWKVVGIVTVIGAVVSLFILGIVLSGTAPSKEIRIENSKTENSSRDDNGTALAGLRSKIRSIDTEGTLVSNVRSGDNDSWAVIEVTTKWHYQPKGARLDATRAFQKAWAYYRNDASALIEIKDLSGNKIGGSKLLGGVYVDD